MLAELRTRSAAALLVLLAAAALTACTGSGAPSPQRRAADAFVSALAAHDAGRAARATDAGTGAQTAIAANLDALGSATKGKITITRTTSSGSRGTAEYAADWTIGTLHWRYTGSFPLAMAAGTWRAIWQRSDLHPKLGPTDHLALVRAQPTRAGLLDSSGQPLFTPTPVVDVGIEKKLVTDLPKLASTLAAIPQLASTAAEITAAVTAAGPTDFVPVITLRSPVYEQIKAKIYNLSGTVFRSGTALLAPSAQYGQPLLGRVGQPTKEIVDASAGRIAAGDATGVGGLQQSLDKTLAGTVGVSVVAEPDLAGSVPATSLAVLRTPTPGTAVTLTLDRSVQNAAESALAGVAKPAAIVAVQRSTGRILADANTSSVTYDYGLAGAFPPGSTFKIATWTAAFTTTPSLTPTSTVNCPATTTVDGRTFENENKFSHPPIPISAAFGYSCNTSAILEAGALPASAIGDAARLLGLGATWTLPVSAFAGSVPAPASATERAADAIGQGRVLASPLLMALMANAATTGKVYAPTLLASAPAAAPGTVPPAIVAKMTSLMTATVDMPGGTGAALSSLGGVQGKTGTAEYGAATPPRTHAWFAGVRNDIAFAVFVYDGATDGGTAVPVVKNFLRGL